MIRRTFLKLMGGVAALAATLKFAPVQAEPPIFTEGDLRPSWCPKGFLPLRGQTITAAEYPDLFLKMVVDGRKYVPPYVGKKGVNLPVDQPYIASELERAGIWDDANRLTRVPHKGAGWDDVEIKLISTEHLRWPNGRPIRAGFMASMQISRAIFEKTYGPIEVSANGKVFSLYDFEQPDYKRIGVL